MAIFTISRQLGSGGGEIRGAIVSALGYDAVDKERLMDEIRPLGGNWERWAHELDQSCPSIWEKYDWSFKGFGALVQSILLDHALEDNVCLTGRGANFLLEGIPNAFRVRVVASLEHRIERIGKRAGVDRDTARWMAGKTDRERAGFIQALYGKNLNDPKFYDKIYDSGETPIEEIAAEIQQTLASKNSLRSAESQELLQLRALAAKIKAAVFTEPRLYIPTFEVEISGKELVLRGIVNNPKHHALIEETARNITGDVPLKSEIRGKW